MAFFDNIGTQEEVNRAVRRERNKPLYLGFVDEFCNKLESNGIIFPLYENNYEWRVYTECDEYTRANGNTSLFDLNLKMSSSYKELRTNMEILFDTLIDNDVYITKFELSIKPSYNLTYQIFTFACCPYK